MEEYVYITDAQHLWGRVLSLKFSTGQDAVVDLTTVLQGPAFERALNDSSFFEQFTLDPDSGTLVWPNGADIAPDALLAGAQLRSDVATLKAPTRSLKSMLQGFRLHDPIDYTSRPNLLVALGSEHPTYYPGVDFIAGRLTAPTITVHGPRESSWSEMDDQAFRSYAVRE